jgi:mannose-6-phosphate isomerase-like protein (cupin superfamily)
VSEVGGDAACWAHLFDDRCVTSFTELAGADGADGADGVVWSSPRGGGLDANVVRLGAGNAIEEHVNEQVDVLLVVWSGTGELEIDDRRVPLAAGTVALIPRNARRRIVARTGGLTYLSTHPARGPLSIGRSRSTG